MSDEPTAEARAPISRELPLDELTARVAHLVDATVADVQRVHGGASGLTYSATIVDGQHAGRVVVKVAPVGLPPVRNRDVLRQARVLEALKDSPVAVPAVVGSDPGDPPDVPPLFVMRFVEGEDVEPLLTADLALDRETIDSRTDHAAEMLAALHRCSVVDGADEPTDLDAEIERWAAAFRTVDDDLKIGADEVLARLRATIPSPVAPCLIHGDWRLGNMLSEGDRVRAVIDWELWSHGDPRVDLGWFELFSDPRHPLRANPTGDLADHDRIVETYRQHSSSSVDHREWFGALVRYKQAAISALILKNARKNPRPSLDPTRITNSIEPLLRAAMARVS